MIDGVTLSDEVQAWLQPLSSDEGPCGPDLEYDNAFLALQQAAAGKPETQFSAAEPPDWRAVRSAAEALLARSRDLRVALLWLRARTQLDGLPGYTQGLALAAGLLRQFGAELHPRPEDGDDYARMNALALLLDPQAALGDLRAAQVLQLRGVGALRLRDFELAANPSLAGESESPQPPAALQRMVTDAIAQGASVQADAEAARAALKALADHLDENPGSEPPPDWRPLRQLLHALQQQLPQAAGIVDAPAAMPGSADAVLPRVAGFSGGVASRADALRAIDAVCDYLERSEPSNPAQLLLRRAQRLIDCNFLELVKELAPDSLQQVARVMGVDPDSVGSPPAGG